MKTEPNDPIQPITLRQVGDNDFRKASDKDIQQGLYLHHKSGLTKREYFAAMAMQGLLTRVPKRDGGEVDLGILELQRIVDESCIAADSLMKVLNEINIKEEGK